MKLRFAGHPMTSNSFGRSRCSSPRWHTSLKAIRFINISRRFRPLQMHSGLLWLSDFLVLVPPDAVRLIGLSELARSGL